MKKNYFKIKEKTLLLKEYNVLISDLILLINHCIKYGFGYDIYYSRYLYYKSLSDNVKNEIKKLESDDNV